MKALEKVPKIHGHLDDCGKPCPPQHLAEAMMPKYDPYKIHREG